MRARESSGMSSGSASRPSNGCRSRARSSAPRRPGKSRPAEGRSRPASLRKLAGEVDFFVAVGNDELGQPDARAPRAARLPRARGHPRPAAAPGLHVRRLGTASGRSRSWARSCTRAARTRFPGTSSRRSTRSTSARATPTRSAPRARRESSWPPRGSCPTLLEAQVPLDALVRSGAGPGRGLRAGPARSSAAPGRLDHGPGRRKLRRGRALRLYAAAELPGAGRRTPTAQATRSQRASPSRSRAGTSRRSGSRFAARCGAAAMTGRGAYDGATSPSTLTRAVRVWRQSVAVWGIVV